jgi:hypothetical protein
MYRWKIHVFLTSALVEGEWSVSLLCRLTPWEGASGNIRQEVRWTPEPAWTIWRR